MNAPNLHLNLLHASERQSSSPVRLRVMLPILAALACVGCLVWWGVLAGQLVLMRGQIRTIKGDLAAKKAEHGGILEQMAAERNLRSELDQLAMYSNGRHTYGELFSRVAHVMPPDIQLMELEIPRPPPQNLLPPGAKPGPKVVPLLGPTNTVEDVILNMRGNTEKWQAVEPFKEAVAGTGGTNSATVSSSISWTVPGRAFTIEYRCRERRFEK